MKLNTARCHLCEREMTLSTLGPAEGEMHGLRMHIEGMPVMRCAGGHTRFVAPDFASRLVDALLQDGELASINAASRGGLLRKRYRCPGCGAALEARVEGHFDAKRMLELKGLDAFEVSVELPKLRCPVCGKECLPPEEVVVEDLMRASANAFRSAAVSPT